MKTNNLNGLNTVLYNNNYSLPKSLLAGELPEHIQKMQMTANAHGIRVILEVEGLNEDNYQVKLHDNNTLGIVVAMQKDIHSLPSRYKEKLRSYKVFVKSEITIPQGYNDIRKVTSAGETLMIMLGKKEGLFYKFHRAMS